LPKDGAAGGGGGAGDAATDGPSSTDGAADGGAADTGGTSDARSDAPAGACDLSKPFAAPALVTALNSSGNEDGLTFSADGLTAYLSSTRTGGLGLSDIWFATRASTAQDFGAPVLVEGVNTASDERGPWISKDGLLLFFFSLPPGGASYHFVVAARQTTVAAFAAPAAVAGLNSSGSDATLWFSGDERTIYFASTRTGGLGDYDIWVADFGASGASNVRAIQELNSAANESWPVLTPDGLTVYYSSGKASAGVSARNHIWMASRSSLNDGFGGQHVVMELSSPASEWPTWISADGCTLYFGSDRPIADGASTIKFYVATRGR
jgi:Tol biopolymer transport system component